MPGRRRRWVSATGDATSLWSRRPGGVSSGMRAPAIQQSPSNPAPAGSSRPARQATLLNGKVGISGAMVLAPAAGRMSAGQMFSGRGQGGGCHDGHDEIHQALHAAGADPGRRDRPCRRGDAERSPAPLQPCRRRRQRGQPAGARICRMAGGGLLRCLHIRRLRHPACAARLRRRARRQGARQRLHAGTGAGRDP